MIELSYTLSDRTVVLREQRRLDLARADFGDLCYKCFGGDLVFRADGADFSIVTGGGVQILDFAVEFFAAARKAAKGKTARVLFAGMADEIHLRPAPEAVEIAPNYTDETVFVPARELVSAARGFLTDVVTGLTAAHPELRRNDELTRYRARVGL
ncbi:hypothetical protein V1J52_07555 [Streptomyces sp. TRM 70351]|uniref:hypothetical protein n=1 Tax=Streptomyces sp. TRM 70351 TaxID=3116552 RepID=UPI002E7BED01|nr:hypothetical protein [Streptomyces sp. TRM 70351]MEE1928052.1 hypothetical protein [Streptomyces sp. TRM 70351]